MYQHFYFFNTIGLVKVELLGRKVCMCAFNLKRCLFTFPKVCGVSLHPYQHCMLTLFAFFVNPVSHLAALEGQAVLPSALGSLGPSQALITTRVSCTSGEGPAGLWVPVPRSSGKGCTGSDFCAVRHN